MEDINKQKAIPYLSATEIKRLKSDLIEKYRESETRVLKSQKLFSLLAKYLKPNFKVLDLGSANGQFFKTLESLGIEHTYGADIDDYLSKGSPHEGFATFDFNMDKYPYADDTFDAITAIEVIEHLENPFYFAREIHRILKKDGIFLMTTPNPSHVFNKILFVLREKLYRFLEGNDHITFLSKHLLDKGILKIFNIETVAHIYPEMPWRFLRHFKYPANKHFGRVVIYVFKKK